MTVPVQDDQGATVSLQFINANGDKRFLTGGRKKGCFFRIGGEDSGKTLVICEGLATGLSLCESLDLAVWIAFDATNLLPVAEAARWRYPDREIILAADFDEPSARHPAPGGTGVALATAAALVTGGSLAVPRHEGRKVDWNDLHKLMGAGEVRTQFMNHRKPERPKETAPALELPPGFIVRLWEG